MTLINMDHFVMAFPSNKPEEELRSLMAIRKEESVAEFFHNIEEAGGPTLSIEDHRRLLMTNRRCALCDELSKEDDNVELHYLAKFKPLFLHHACWRNAQRLEMKLEKA